MKKSISNTVSTVVGAALLCALPPATGLAQSYSIRPTCNPTGQCRPNTLFFGYNDTNWREWPVQPRPEQKNSLSVGGQVIPPPPPIIEKPLPHAENLPTRPALPGGDILPGGMPAGPPGLTPGPIMGPGPGGATPNPAGGTRIEGLPPGIDLSPLHPDTTLTPNGSGSFGTPGLTPKDTDLPPGAVLEPVTPPSAIPSGTPAAKPAKKPEADVPAPKAPTSPAERSPAPTTKPDALKPDAPSPAGGSSFSRLPEDAVGASAGRGDLPMQANWNAALGPDVAGSPAAPRLRSAGSEQAAASQVNPPRFSMDGYCPVQLLENDHWVPGNPSLQTSYEGQLFQFSDGAALKRFEASPEKYAPVQSGSDVVLAREENRVVRGSVNHSAVWHGHVYLFASSANLAAFQEDPARYVHPQRHEGLRLPAESVPAGF